MKCEECNEGKMEFDRIDSDTGSEVFKCNVCGYENITEAM